MLDKHDEHADDLIVRLQQLFKAMTCPGRMTTSNVSYALYKKVLDKADQALEAFDPTKEHLSIVEQHGEVLSTQRQDLRTIKTQLLELGFNDDHELNFLHSEFEELHFKWACRV